MVRLSDLDYDLPEELIAQTPLSDRSASRLLHVDRATGALSDRRFTDALDLFAPGDTLVFNNTRVNPWRLMGHRPTGGSVEVLLTKQRSGDTFEGMLRPARRLRPGDTLHFPGGCEAKLIEKSSSGIQTLRFTTPDGASAIDRIAEIGQVPLPPYIVEKLDQPERYQTVFAERAGSAAAPTAALHFTNEILAAARERGVRIAFVTLHVSIDTFRPVTVDDPADHVMHGEWCEIRPDAAEIINTAPGRIIAVGTTAVRTLESMATGSRRVQPGQRETKIFVTPGFQFQVVDGMFTNFHMPRTTMLLMLAALIGKPALMRAYRHAVQERYRFLSFGDSMLIL